MKSGIKIFFPDFRFEDVTKIDVNLFNGSDLLIFDVDNTLVFPETSQTKKEIIDWFSKIKNNYQCICLSNSSTIKRRKDDIEKILNCKVFLSKYKKPSKKLFLEIKKEFPLAKNIIAIGDRIIPDILFGNLNGMTTILVDILSPKEKLYIRILRILENIILNIHAPKE